MRLCFARAGTPSPKFIVIRKRKASSQALAEEYEELLKKTAMEFPLVVKPVDNMGGRGCRRLDSFKDLETALPEALAFSRSGRAIVEEFMNGQEFSVDALVDHEEITICGFADRHICFPPYFIEMGHTMPSSLDERHTEALLKVFKDGIRALGITRGVGAAKGDIKLSSKGPMIGEIAARLSGGYMSGWTYPYSSGVEVTRGAIELALGRKLGNPEPKQRFTSAERAFISIPGKVRSMITAKARSEPFVKDLFLRISAGSSVSFPENNVGKCGNVISAAPDRDEAVKAAETGARSILIRLEAPNQETDEFLRAPRSRPGMEFPPDAFDLPPFMGDLLESLPEDRSGGRRDRGETEVIDFPEFIESEIKDYVGRSVSETLDAGRTLTGLALPILDDVRNASGPVLGRAFWKALVRGGYQGAVYYIDRKE
jgi:biotin carboxylase